MNYVDEAVQRRFSQFQHLIRIIWFIVSKEEEDTQQLLSDVGAKKKSPFADQIKKFLAKSIHQRGANAIFE